MHCIDFRFIPAIRDWMEKEGFLGDSDVVSVAGAVKNIVSPKEQSDKDLILRQIEISKRLHGIDEIILVNHTDCGAYGGKSAFANELEEEQKHELDLREARAVLQAAFPSLNIRLALARMAGGGKIDFVEKI